MANRDLRHQVKSVPALAPIVRLANTAVNGADIDRTGFEAIMYIVHFGAWTDGTHTPKIQEADDNGSGAPGTYSDVAAGDLNGAFTALSAAPGANTTQEVNYIGQKKWSRIVLTTAGATSGAGSEAMAILGYPRNLPQ
jgi:hypothetical protein